MLGPAARAVMLLRMGWAYGGAALRLRRNARLQRGQFEQLRLRQFRDLVRHAYRHSPYYARIIDARGIDVDRCVPGDFPVLTKRLLHENFDDIVTDRRLTREAIIGFLRDSRDPDERFLDEFVVLHTSGSSGEVGYFVFSETDWMRGYAGFARAAPLAWGRTRVAFFGAAGGHFAAVSWSSTARRGLGRWLFDVKAFDVNAPLAHTLSELSAYRPDLLAGYASSLKILGEAQARGQLNVHPRGLQCGGEPLSAGDQEWLAEVFGCPCVNIYGATETMLMGIARSGDPGMTLFDDQLIFEPAEDHTLVTALFNRTMPLIRYRLGDVVRPTGLASPYGPYPVIRPVVGRNEWMPTFRNVRGEMDFIHPLVLAEIFVPGVWRFQMRWRDETAFRFAICLDPSLSVPLREAAVSAFEQRVREILEQKELANVGFSIEVVDEIAPDPQTRKFRLVVQESAGQPERSSAIA